MSACPDKQDLLHGLLDGELDAAHALAAEAHLKACPGCADAFARLEALRRLARAPGMRMAAPEALRERIEAALAAEAPKATALQAEPGRRGRLAAAAPWALSGALAATAAALALALVAPGAELQVLQQEVVSGHVRAMEADHALDVATSDRHTVKPWFNGRLDFAPPVEDLAAQGYTLAGGRLDYLHERRVAALVYRRRQHLINLFVWPARAGERLSGTARRGGYSLVWWTGGGLEFWAVSDVDPQDLAQFRQAFQRAAPT